MRKAETLVWEVEIWEVSPVKMGNNCVANSNHRHTVSPSFCLGIVLLTHFSLPASTMRLCHRSMVQPENKMTPVSVPCLPQPLITEGKMWLISVVSNCSRYLLSGCCPRPKKFPCSQACVPGAEALQEWGGWSHATVVLGLRGTCQRGYKPASAVVGGWGWCLWFPSLQLHKRVEIWGCMLHRWGLQRLQEASRGEVRVQGGTHPYPSPSQNHRMGWVGRDTKII